jgi:ammonia channel protein AmtB
MGGYLGTVMLGIFADKDVNGIQGSGEQVYIMPSLT